MDNSIKKHVFKVLQGLNDHAGRGAMKRGQEVDQTAFIGNIPFLKSWPIQKLTENPAALAFHYFGPGQVVVRDSLDSDWIYIVKSGSVSVMKRVQGRRTRWHSSVGSEGGLPPGRSRFANVSLDVSLPYKERKYRRKPCPPVKLPPIPKPKFHSHFEMQMKMNDTVPGIHKENDRLGILDYDRILEDYKSRARPSRLSEVASPVDQQEDIENADRPANDLRSDDVSESDVDCSSVADKSTFPTLRKTTQGVYMSRSTARRRTRHKDKKKPMEFGEEGGNFDSHDPDRPGTETRSPRTLDAAGGRPVTSEPDLRTTMTSPPTTESTFILVQVLERGQYFGVGDLVFRESQPSLSVVSNGAECILLSKSFFKQHATEHVINSLRRTEVPYPSEQILKRKLREHQAWANYRSRSYRRLVQPIVEKKARKKQYTTSYMGQYNFRTGPL